MGSVAPITTGAAAGQGRMGGSYGKKIGFHDDLDELDDLDDKVSQTKPADESDWDDDYGL